jgi:hypothetical protein
MCIVETHDPLVIRTVKRERVALAVRAFLGRLYSLDFKLCRKALLVPMNPPVESHQELEGMDLLVRHILSWHDMVEIRKGFKIGLANLKKREFIAQIFLGMIRPPAIALVRHRL